MRNKKCPSQQEIHRREFLKQLLAGGIGLSTLGNPARLAFATLFNQFLLQADANAAGVYDDYNFVNFLITDGTARCIFDLPLKPSASDPLVQNAYCGNRFDANLNILHQSAIAHPNFNGIQMPYLWQSNIPRPGGGSTALANLAPNLLMIRGINQQVDGHPFNRILQTLPTPGLSTTGMAADAASTPIPSIQVGQSPPEFVSKKGLTARRTNSIANALTPFSGASSLTEISSATVDSAIDGFLNMMRDRPGDKHPYLPATYQDRANAKSLMKRNFGDLTQAYTNLRNKYTDLMSRSFNDSAFYLPNLEGMTIGGSPSDVRFNITEPYRWTGTSIQGLFGSQAKVNDLAESFAISEFMMVNRITSSIGASIGAFGGLNWQQYRHITTGAITNNDVSSLGLDFHTVGSVMNLFLMTKYYRALAACLYEFISQLKATPRPSGGNLFDRTVIALNGDFNRSGRADMRGSDHGWNGSSYSIFSGMIQQCEVVGNITSETGTYNGTWGRAAPTAANGNRELLLGNAVSTVATMMNLPSPTPNDSSVVSKNQSTGLVTASFPRGINVP